MRISFLWDGVSSRMGWGDGLWAALQIMAESNTIGYFEPSDIRGIEKFKPDVLLHWASSTEEVCKQVKEYPWPKANCFAGGQHEGEWTTGYDLYFVENQFILDQMLSEGKRAMLAFGVNDKLFRPMSLPKSWDGIIAGTFADWKRHNLFAAALGNRGIAVGIKQDNEKWCYEVCEKAGVDTRTAGTREDVAMLINQSTTVVNTANVWGGGQRLTLEAMACNTPPIVMSDSPKNCEYVRESGFGFIVNPDVGEIRHAISTAKKYQLDGGRKYIESKWTAQHYTDNLMAGLKQL